MVYVRNSRLQDFKDSHEPSFLYLLTEMINTTYITQRLSFNEIYVENSVTAIVVKASTNILRISTRHIARITTTKTQQQQRY